MFFFAVGLKDKHLAYVYSLGVCEVNRRTISCPGLTNFIENVDELGFSPWWDTGNQKSKLQKWPEKPKELNYVQVHDYREEPWCTYVLKHECTVAASTLNADDLKRFEYARVTKKKLFERCTLEKDDEENMRAMEWRLQRHLEQCRVVIPLSLVSQRCQEMEKDLLLDTGSDKATLCQQILRKVDDSDSVVGKEEIIKLSVQESIINQNLNFLGWLQKLREIKQLNVDKEIQAI